MARTERRDAIEILDKLTNSLDGFEYTHEEILDYIIKNHLSGDDAVDCMLGFLEDKELDDDPEFKKYQK
jgi:hypothetical protein